MLNLNTWNMLRKRQVPSNNIKANRIGCDVSSCESQDVPYVSDFLTNVSDLFLNNQGWQTFQPWLIGDRKDWFNVHIPNMLGVCPVSKICDFCRHTIVNM